MNLMTARTDIRKRHIAVFASGNGSNAENIIRYFRANSSEAEVALIVCNKKDAGVVERARRLGVTSVVLGRDRINDPEVILPILRAFEIDAIVLAGFLLMVPPFMVECYDGRILNIHPSLLPKFGGKGMYGSKVHEAVVAAGEAKTGITIHLVNNHCDGGEIIFQKSVPVDSADTPADVERKIHALEREFFPDTILRWMSTLSARSGC